MKDIEQYLRENAPETPEEGQFMIETNARLNAVEGIKATVDGERRRGRIALIVALCLRGRTPRPDRTVNTANVPYLDVNAAQTEALCALADQAGKALEALQDKQEFLFGGVALLAVALGIVSLRKKETVL